MTLPGALAEALEQVLGDPPRAARAVSGGDLNHAWRVDLAGGATAFVKTSPDARPGAYRAEAAGLRALAAPGVLQVPAVLAVVDPDGEPAALRLLALEWIDEGRLDPAGEAELGRGLAAVHAAGAPVFGGPQPLFIGPLELPNGPAASWAELYAEHRILPLTRVASDRDALPAGAELALERVCERMPELAGPREQPALVHGDLWAGNVLAGSDRRPWLIDPACHGGHRELDLAMLRLFGGPGERTFSAYSEAWTLPDGHEERVRLWQLFPLLVHAVLFGGGYGARAAAIAREYA